MRRKLTAQQVREIRRAPRRYGYIKALADQHLVSHQTIRRVLRWEVYKRAA